MNKTKKYSFENFRKIFNRITTQQHVSSIKEEVHGFHRLEKEDLFENSWEESNGICTMVLKTTNFDNGDILYSPKDIGYPKNKVEVNKEADEYYYNLTKYQTGMRPKYSKEKDFEKINDKEIIYEDLYNHIPTALIIRDDDVALITLLNDTITVTLRSPAIEECEILFKEKEDD